MGERSHFFSSLYEQSEPVGHFGRGAHYSVFRSVCWQVPGLSLREEGVPHDFAVVWDEDHDERVLGVIDRIYLAGLLSPLLFIGERKGGLYYVISEEAAVALEAAGKLSHYKKKLEALSSTADGDCWQVLSLAVYGREDTNMFNGSSEDVELFVRSIAHQWKLCSQSEAAFQLPSAYGLSLEDSGDSDSLFALLPDLSEEDSVLLYAALKGLIDSGGGDYFHNSDIGHPVYQVGAGSAHPESFAYADGQDRNVLFRHLVLLSDNLRDSQARSEMNGFVDFSSWESFCKYVVSVDNKLNRFQSN